MTFDAKYIRVKDKSTPNYRKNKKFPAAKAENFYLRILFP